MLLPNIFFLLFYTETIFKFSIQKKQLILQYTNPPAAGSHPMVAITYVLSNMPHPVIVSQAQD